MGDKLLLMSGFLLQDREFTIFYHTEIASARCESDRSLNSSTGHCCVGDDLDSIRINIGDHLWKEGDEKSYMEIKKILIHPDYRSGNTGGFPYDFCMIQTKEKMVIDGVKTQVACFPEAGAHADGNEAECWTAGWGQVSFGYIEDPLQLQTLKVNLYDDNICYNHALNLYSKKSDSEILSHDYYDYYDYYDNDNNNTNNHRLYNSEVEFCAGHYDVTNNTYTAEASSCYGDSGGPLGRDRQVFHII